jgi:drug/metabolite transporter (DMT)-like permease
MFIPGAPGQAESLFGAILVLLAAMTFAGSQLLAKRAVDAMGARLFTCIAMTAASAAAFIQYSIVHYFSFVLPAANVVVLGCVLAVAGTVLPSFFMNAALRHITAQANAAVGAISPIATIMLAVLFLGETLTAASVLGGLLVILGVVWFAVGEKQ